MPDGCTRPPAVFTGIPADRVDEFWPRIADTLWRAIVRTDGAHTLLSTKHAIQDGTMQLWAAFHDPEMMECIAALVTQTQVFPSGMEICEIVFCAAADDGDVIPGCLPLLDHIEAWARSVGCCRLRLLGRPGWSKVLPSFAVSAVVLERDLALPLERQRTLPPSSPT